MYKQQRKNWLSFMMVMMLVFASGCSVIEELEAFEHETEALSDSDYHEHHEHSHNENDRIHFIDTGNSDAILIQHGEEGVLIDGGDNNDEAIVPQYIRQVGVKKLRLIVATHNDADHIGGLDGVARSIPVEEVWVSNGDADTKTYRDFIETLAAKGLHPSVPLVGKELKLGKATLTVLAANNMKDTNDNSLVIRYTNGDDTALFLGDLKDTLDTDLGAGDIDLIKVSHHGAKNGTSETLLRQTKPQFAVITTGKNQYGHPHAELLQRLDGIEIHRTDECGDIVFRSTGHGLHTDCTTGQRGNRTEPPVVPLTPLSPSVPPTNKVATNEATETVYWTKSGSKYHNNADCSNMKEPISGTIEESGNRTPCAKCYKD